MTTQRYEIYRHKETLLNEDDAEKHYTAVSEEALQTGLIAPRTNPLLESEPVGVVEATSPEEAVAKYIESTKDSWL